jgi:hypothetical protein
MVTTVFGKQKTKRFVLQIQKWFFLFQNQERGWTGLLVEPNYLYFNAMKQKNRKVDL